MSDVEKFLDKVMAPVRGGAPGATIASAIVLPAGAKALPVTEEELQQRYAEALNAVYADAIERREVQIFADVLAWELAVIATRNGPQATGDILQRLGIHLMRLAATDEAKREADQAREQGRRPN